jgi:hypothetical protein
LLLNLVGYSVIDGNIPELVLNYSEFQNTSMLTTKRHMYSVMRLAAVWMMLYTDHYTSHFDVGLPIKTACVDVTLQTCKYEVAGLNVRLGILSLSVIFLSPSYITGVAN